MKIFISIPEKTSRWFWNINNLLSNSLIDCGYSMSDYNESDVVIVIQHLPSNVKKFSDKKYILLQTEQKHDSSSDLNKYSLFGPDKIWGFNINDAKEDYICLGYHPCLEYNENCSFKFPISFIGCNTKRRSEFFSKVRNKVERISCWNYEEKLKNIKSTKVNINIHSYMETKFTEWDRICLIIANKAFLLSEKFYCPLPINQFDITKNDYDDKIDYFLNHSKERIDIANHIYELYKKDFDMRNILTKKLKEVL